MNGPKGPAPNTQPRPHSSTCRPLAPTTRRGGFHGSSAHPSHGPAAGRIRGCGPVSRKGFCFSHDRARPSTQQTTPPPPLPTPPLSPQPQKGSPHPLLQPVAPERTQASISGPGSRGETLTTPGGPAHEMGVWLQDSPPPSPLPRAGPALTPILRSSPSLPHRDRSAPPAISVPVPLSSGLGTWERVSILAVTPARLRRGQPRSGLSAAGASRRPRRARAASLGREPCGSLPAKYRPASLCSDASRNRELPLSLSSQLGARTPSCFAEPSPLSASASAAPTQPPRPLCPWLFAGGTLLPGALQSEPPVHGGIRLGVPQPRPISAVDTCPGARLPRPARIRDGALCPAVLQRAQGRARVSPPGSSCSGAIC
ncbi:uncharacterized protein [Bos taurus]|uniref:uncharacterized protein n=1 Tax=Bos taurus TaxID=9913 RepID=UPI0028CB84F1|nr:uncharacterized protein LOC132343390 [Bos taurus]